MKDIRILSIIVGIIADYAVAFLVGIPVVIVFIMATMGRHPVAPKDVYAHVEQITHSLPFLWATIALGGFGSLVGGFVTGWIAKAARVKNATVMGVLSTLPGFFFMVEFPIWYDAVSVLVTIGPAVAGGYFAQRLFGSRAATPA